MIRTLNFADVERLTELHKKQGFNYVLPPIFAMAVKRGYEHNGHVVTAILCRPTVELYMLADPDWASPAARFEVLKELHEDVRQELARAGFTDALMWIPPQKEKTFPRRLKRYFGWVDVPWKCLTRLTSA